MRDCGKVPFLQICRKQPHRDSAALLGRVAGQAPTFVPPMSAFCVKLFFVQDAA